MVPQSAKETGAPAVIGEADTTSNHAAAGVRKTRERILNMGHLVLSRKIGEVILIGDNIRITTVRIGPNSVRYGIEAPREMNIVREELLPRDRGEPNDELPIERSHSNAH
jgi:carbon storage regulator